MTWPPSVPFVPENVDGQELQAILADLVERVGGYQNWVDEYGFASRVTVEHILSGVYEANRNCSEWAIAAMEWSLASSAIHPGLHAIAEILAEVSEKIRETIPNDIGTQTDRPVWVLLPADCDMFRFEDVILGQLELVTDQVSQMFAGVASGGVRLAYGPDWRPEPLEDADARLEASPNPPQPDGPGEGSEFYWEGHCYDLEVEPKPMELLRLFWKRLGDRQEITLEIPKVAREVWRDGRFPYDSMKPTISRLNSAFDSYRLPFKVSKTRNRNELTFGRTTT